MKNTPTLRSLLAALFSLAFVQTGWGQSFTEGLNNSVTNVAVTGGAYFTGNSTGSDSPASSPFASEGTHSRGVSSGTATITSNTINTIGGTGISLSFRLASFSITSTGNGADTDDTVIVAISPDGGTTYYNTLTIAGNTNARWSYTSGTGVASTAYDGNTNSVSFTPAAGGNRTTDGYSTVTVTGLPAVASMRYRITMKNDNANERWVADNIVFSGTFPPPPAITGAATASAFTTTYGTPSTAQTFSVSGANLTANLVATAPSGFEVASDGATYGGTATFTQSGGSASGTLSLRLKATAAVAFYNSKNIVLSTTGATSVNIVTTEDGNRVSAKALSITASARTKTYGDTLPLGTSSFSSDGLANSDTIGAVTLASSGIAASAAVGSYPITPSAATGGTFTASNYIITYNNGTLTVEPKALTITAFAVTKASGDTLASPVTGSTAFTSDGLVGSETIGSVTISYGTGAASGDAVGAYADQVTPSAAVGGTFDIANYLPTYVSATLSVTANPTITAAGALAAVDTTYGTPSAAPSSFTVSGIFLTGDLTVTPPAGFEVSSSIGSGYSTSLTLPASGTLVATSVYVRLAATTAFGTYSGNITVSGGGATSQTVATASSSVAKKSLTITGLTGANKPYDGTLAASTTGTAEYIGLENSETFTVTGTASATFTAAGVGTAKPITMTGYTEPSSNYTVSQPIGLSADITPLALTITPPTIADKVYSGNTTPGTLTVGTLSGFVGSETVTVTGSSAQYPSANVGTYAGNVITYTLANGTNGGLAENYSLANGTADGTITKRNLTITANSVFKNVGVTLTDGPGSTAFTTINLISTETIGSVTMTYGPGGLAGAAVGSYPGEVTPSAATGGTFAAANYNITYAVGDITITVPLIAGWDFQTTTSGGTAIAASPISPTTYNANIGTGVIYLDGTNGSSSWAQATELNGFTGTAVNAATGFSTTTTSPACLALLAGSGNSANGKKLVFKFSMAARTNLLVSYATQKTSTGFDSHLWEFSTNGTTWTTAETISSIPTSFAIKSLAPITDLDGATNAYLRLTVSGSTGSGQNNRLDNIQIRAADVPTITSVGSVAAFTTTFGTASAEQTFEISGVNLGEDLTATAPTGFEVSSDGTSYGSTVTFTQSSGTASGSLRIRLAATAAVSGSYNSQNIVLSSSGATSVNITTAASGNVVSKATPTIATAPTASDITFGETLADSDLTGGEASTVGTFAFTTPSTAPNAGTASRGVTFTPTDGDNYNSTTTTVSVTTNKATPTITTAPTASGITSGETLASSSLTGGFASTDGTFAFTTPGTSPAVGTANQGVTFTPTDTDNYNTATTTVSVTVSSGSDPLFTTVGNSPTITFAAGAANIAFTGIPGRTYGIERSATLTDWTQIDTVTADSVSGAATYRDSSPLLPAAFYRIVYPPAGN